MNKDEGDLKQKKQNARLGYIRLYPVHPM